MTVLAALFSGISYSRDRRRCTQRHSAFRYAVLAFFIATPFTAIG